MEHFSSDSGLSLAGSAVAVQSRRYECVGKVTFSEVALDGRFMINLWDILDVDVAASLVVNYEQFETALSANICLQPFGYVSIYGRTSVGVRGVALTLIGQVAIDLLLARATGELMLNIENNHFVAKASLLVEICLLGSLKLAGEVRNDGFAILGAVDLNLFGLRIFGQVGCTISYRAQESVRKPWLRAARTFPSAGAGHSPRESLFGRRARNQSASPPGVHLL